MLVVGLIDIQHMQSVIKEYIAFLVILKWPRNPELKSSSQMTGNGPNVKIKTGNQPYLPEGFTNWQWLTTKYQLLPLIGHSVPNAVNHNSVRPNLKHCAYWWL